MIRLMKKMLMKIALVIGLMGFFNSPEMKAQVAVNGNEVVSALKYSRGNLWDGENRLDKSEVQKMLLEQDFDKYMSSRRLYKSGMGLTIAGGVLVVSNSIPLIWHEYFHQVDPDYPVTRPGVLLNFAGLALGGAMLVSGVPCLCTGVGKMKNLAASYNGYQPQLTFGPTSEGIGLALKF